LDQPILEPPATYRHGHLDAALGDSAPSLWQKQLTTERLNPPARSSILRRNPTTAWKRRRIQVEKPFVIKVTFISMDFAGGRRREAAKKFSRRLAIAYSNGS